MIKTAEIKQTFYETVIIDLPDLNPPISDEAIKEIVMRLYDQDEISIDHDMESADHEIMIEIYSEEKRNGFAYQEIGIEKTAKMLIEIGWE